MTKISNSVREEAFNLYKNSVGKITSKEIAEKLGKSIHTINSWRQKDQWTKRIKGGAPKGNANSKGHGAPKGNLNRLKHGKYISEDRFKDKKFMAKYLPKAMANTMFELSESNINPIDMLWGNILIQQTKILHMQNIIYVKDKNDITKVIKKQTSGKNASIEYEYQFAWDRETSGVKALSDAIKVLTNMIKQYDEMINKNWNMATKEQKLRVEKLKVEIENIKTTNNTTSSSTVIFEGENELQD